jgi:hypothetical protein
MSTLTGELLAILSEDLIDGFQIDVNWISD